MLSGPFAMLLAFVLVGLVAPALLVTVAAICVGTAKQGSAKTAPPEFFAERTSGSRIVQAAGVQPAMQLVLVGHVVGGPTAVADAPGAVRTPVRAAAMASGSARWSSPCASRRRAWWNFA